MPKLIAITSQQFADKAWKRYTSYAFASHANLIPVVAAELAKLVPEMPLGFAQTENTFQLVAITSLQSGTNLLVAPDGRWLGAYVPATLRGYPFWLVKPEGQENGILCFDESSGLLVDAGQGEAFFDEAGEPSQPVKDMMNFCSQIELNRVATQTAVDALSAAGLVLPWPISAKNGDKSVAVKGLFKVDEAALNALPDEALLLLRTTGALALAYAQLLSMNQFNVLEKLSTMQQQLQSQAATHANEISGLEGFRLSQDDGKLNFDLLHGNPE